MHYYSYRNKPKVSSSSLFDKNIPQLFAQEVNMDQVQEESKQYEIESFGNFKESFATEEDEMPEISISDTTDQDLTIKVTKIPTLEKSKTQVFKSMIKLPQRNDSGSVENQINYPRGYSISRTLNQISTSDPTKMLDQV